jgi:hypothetical protein
MVSLAAVGLVGGALVLAGCGTSSDTVSTAATASTTASAPIECVGSEETCTARVPLGGGASARTVEIALTGTDMGEPKTTVAAEYEGAYNITNTAFTTGGSVYQFTLDAVESIPDGVDLEMTFTQKM